MSVGQGDCVGGARVGVPIGGGSAVSVGAVEAVGRGVSVAVAIGERVGDGTGVAVAGRVAVLRMVGNKVGVFVRVDRGGRVGDGGGEWVGVGCKVAVRVAAGGCFLGVAVGILRRGVGLAVSVFRWVSIRVTSAMRNLSRSVAANESGVVC